MQQQPNLTTAQKIERVEAALALPGLDAMERQTYQDTLRILKQHAQSERPKTPTAPSPASPNSGRGETDRAAPLRATTIRMQSGGNPVKVQSASPTRYNPQIIIERAGEEPENLTPGECRSKFWTRLNELLETSAWEKQLLHELPDYATFQSAVTYYAALTAHWQRPPSLSDLKFNHARFSEIFEIVTSPEWSHSRNVTSAM